MPLNSWAHALLIVLISTTIARAHGISVLCDVEPPNHVVVTAYFGMEPAAGAAVRVTDTHGAELAIGTLDESGRYTFAAPEAVAYVFEVTIAGHRAQCRLDPDQVARLGIGPDTFSPHDALHAAEAGREGHESQPPPADAPGHDSAHTGTQRRANQSTPAHDHGANADHLHPATAFPIVELIAGLALIISLSSLAMTFSLRREIRAHLDQRSKPGE